MLINISLTQYLVRKPPRRDMLRDLKFPLSVRTHPYWSALNIILHFSVYLVGFAALVSEKRPNFVAVVRSLRQSQVRSPRQSQVRSLRQSQVRSPRQSQVSSFTRIARSHYVALSAPWL